MFRWKDFLYFSKGDKVGISLLMILIVVSGIFYVYLNKLSPIDPSYIAQSEQLEHDFIKFEESLIPAEIVTESLPLADIDNAPSRSKNTKKDLSKLTDGQTLDINVASATTLTRIPGIGETLAKRIFEYRTALGGFVDLNQLQEIKGITSNKLSKILPYIIIQKKHKRISINKSNLAHPYLSEQQTESIYSLRSEKIIESIDELADSDYFTAKDMERLEPYLDFK